MNIQIVDKWGEEVKSEPETIAEPASVSGDGQILQSEVANLFDLKPSEASEFKDNINILIDYAKSQTDDHSPEGIKWAIRDLEFKLGTPPLGEKSINYLTMYAKLRTQQKEVTEKVAKYEHH